MQTREKNNMNYDFQDGKGLVPAKRHSNGGGWVADSASVADTAYVGPDAWVFGNAEVFGNARVFGNAKVSGNAGVYGNAEVSGNAGVYGNAEVSDNARINHTPVQVTRSDGYTFIMVNCADDISRIIAGCRFFTYEEAIQHWNATRGGTTLGEESIMIVNFLKNMYEMQNKN